MAPAPLPVGLLGRFTPAHLTVTLTEPAHPGPAGHVGRRTLVTTIWYPGIQPASTRFPLIVFGPGFQKCAGSYAPLLSAWASAGYVVAAVNFPYTNCHSGSQDEADLVNQPGDLSYALTQLLGPASGDIPVPVNPRQVAAAGQSDGGDAVTSLAASKCCADGRFAAVAVLSGQNSPYLPAAMDFSGQGAPPMLFTQGTSDSWNVPASSFALFQADQSRAKYYLRLPHASHLGPYTQVNPAQQAVVRVSVAFFGHYLLRLPGTLAAMQRAGNVPGVAQLISG